MSAEEFGSHVIFVWWVTINDEKGRKDGESEAGGVFIPTVALMKLYT